MLQDLCINPQLKNAEETVESTTPEKIIIIIEAGKIVWFNTNGKFPSAD